MPIQRRYGKASPVNTADSRGVEDTYRAARVTAVAATVEALAIGLLTAWVVVELLEFFSVQNVASAFGATIIGVGLVASAHLLLARALGSGSPPRARWRILLYAVLALQLLIVPSAGVIATDHEEGAGLRIVGAVISISGAVVMIAAFALLVAMAIRDRRAALSA